MPWTLAERLDAAIRGPLGDDLHRPDTRVVARPGWYQVITPSTRGSVLNEVVLSELDEADCERVIDETIAAYRAHDLPVKWCVGPWSRPADLGERLARRGFVCWGVRGMTCATDRAIDVPEGVVIEEVGPDRVEVYTGALVRGWDLPDDQRAATLAQHRASMARSPRTAHFFLATVDGEPAGTTGVLLRERYGYLVGAQILAPFRGRGLYRALIAARMGFLHARGRTLAVTQAREATSAPMLEHLGFETVFRSRCYLLEPREGGPRR